jgi:acetyl esterase/lipase
MPRTLFALLLVAVPLFAQSPKAERTEDVIYGRKFGTALTLDVFTPEKPNGAAVIYVVSGGWFSAKENVNPFLYAEFLKKGYTVFAVVHGSQPKYAIPECVADVQRAVRWVRANAKKYKIDPETLGIVGISAGGHLSLMIGTTAKDGDAKSKDPVEQQPAKVAAVAAFVPPTDFLNWGKEGVVSLGDGPLNAFKAPFEFTEFDTKTNTFTLVADKEKRKEIGKQISPITHATKSTAPTLIIHGEKDRLVPVQQAERLIAKLKEEKVECELVVKKGADHVWAEMPADMAKAAEWFEKQTKKEK